jgi:hypothetical protein
LQGEKALQHNCKGKHNCKKKCNDVARNHMRNNLPRITRESQKKGRERRGSLSVARNCKERTVREIDLGIVRKN